MLNQYTTYYVKQLKMKERKNVKKKEKKEPYKIISLQLTAKCAVTDRSVNPQN